jgi:rhodanese-related sulfurtransferase
VAQELLNDGFTDVYALRGGFDAWRAVAGPVVPK